MPKRESRKKGDVCPKISVEIGGEKLALREWWEQGPLLIVFYGGDLSPYALIQLRRLKREMQKFQSAGIRLLALGTGNEQSHAEFVKQLDLPFECVLDKKKAAARSFGILRKNESALVISPHVFSIDQKGIIRFSRGGFPKVHDILRSFR